MALFDDEPARAVPSYRIGQDLAALSLHEIDEHIEALKAEIERLREARIKKEASASLADSFFKQ